MTDQLAAAKRELQEALKKLQESQDELRATRQSNLEVSSSEAAAKPSRNEGGEVNKNFPITSPETDEEEFVDITSSTDGNKPKGASQFDDLTSKLDEKLPKSLKTISIDERFYNSSTSSRDKSKMARSFYVNLQSMLVQHHLNCFLPEVHKLLEAKRNNKMVEMPNFEEFNSEVRSNELDKLTKMSRQSRERANTLIYLRVTSLLKNDDYTDATSYLDDPSRERKHDGRRVVINFFMKYDQTDNHEVLRRARAVYGYNPPASATLYDATVQLATLWKNHQMIVPQEEKLPYSALASLALTLVPVEFRSELRTSKIGRDHSGSTESDWNDYIILLASCGRQVKAVSRSTMFIKEQDQTAFTVQLDQGANAKHGKRWKKKPYDRRQKPPPPNNGTKHCIICEKSNHTTEQCRRLKSMKIQMKTPKQSHRQKNEDKAAAKPEDKAVMHMFLDGKLLKIFGGDPTIEDPSPDPEQSSQLPPAPHPFRPKQPVFNVHVAHPAKTDNFLVDSGASVHVISKRHQHLAQNIRKKFSTLSGVGRMEVRRIGDVRLPVLDSEGNPMEIFLQDCLLPDDEIQSLISSGMLRALKRLESYPF